MIEIQNFNTFRFDRIQDLEIPKDLPIYILPGDEPITHEISQILIQNLPSAPVYLPPLPVACPVKCSQKGFFIILTPVCDLHLFKHYAVLEKYGTRKIERTYIDGIEHINLTGSNRNIAKYFQMRYDNITITSNIDSEVSKFDRVKFLISRLAKVEKISKSTIFAIYFTNACFFDYARYLKKVLKSRNKVAYLVQLSDVSFERLSCIDGVDCAIVIDCEYYNWFDIELNIPLIVPFELSMAFSEWKGDYDINSIEIEEQPENNEECTELIVQEFYSTGELIKKNEIQTVSFFVEDEMDDTVHDGQSGIAGDYK